MVKVRIYWLTKDKEMKESIKRFFGIIAGESVNGETETFIKDKDVPMLNRGADKGLYALR